MHRKDLEIMLTDVGINIVGNKVKKSEIIAAIGASNNFELTNLPLSSNAFDKLKLIDKKFLGTPDYMGMEWFWHYDYRHYLRDASYETRKKVHDALIEVDLPLSESSPEHESIIKKLAK